MSIIYDALNKVEKSSAKDAAANEETKPQAKGPVKQSIAIYIITAIAGLLIGYALFFFMSLKGTPPENRQAPKIQPSEKPAISAAETPRRLPSQTQAKPAPPDTKQTKKKPKLATQYTLNGIFFSQDEGNIYALVNNQIVRAGETVDGALLKEITLEEVVLVTEEGTTLTLTTNN